MQGKIFINYRRGDDPGHTGRLFDHLQEVFQPDQLFMDVDSIAPGLDFVHVLEEQVAKCDVLLAVIGHGWLDARDGAGKRRLDNADDSCGNRGGVAPWQARNPGPRERR